ncbi:MAG: hypothetical protein A2W93_12275 [Bacteroidetes bacterium GWF2_43_63]|nr:MAG: hypothetical protein A2W93_12275 [Bacteroidetes bacterium GWF2_43_63]HBG71213.1 hypothetical protein [Bacteroidales bacterium]HCB61296.1 hypothetical protein [Bacteroidales bacterium]HCY23313.1 hypothetical protein [Bacteroidales bacterium]
MKKVAGTTLIESLVATVIIMTVVGISSMIIAGSFRSHTNLPRLQAISVSDSLCESIISEGSFSDREFSKNGLRYSVTFSVFPSAKNILVMTVDAKNNLDQNIGSFHYLIPDY